MEDQLKLGREFDIAEALHGLFALAGEKLPKSGTLNQTSIYVHPKKNG